MELLGPVINVSLTEALSTMNSMPAPFSCPDILFFTEHNIDFIQLFNDLMDFGFVWSNFRRDLSRQLLWNRG